MVDQTEVRNLQHELAYEAALDDLRKPSPDSLDIENALDQLAGIPSLRPNQIRGFLTLAASCIRMWGELVGTDIMVERLTPHVQSLRQTVEESDKPEEKEEFYRTATQLSTGILQLDPTAYRGLASRGYFDDEGQVLRGTLEGLLGEYDKKGRLWGEDDAEQLTPMLADLVAKGNSEHIVSLQPVLPVRFLYFYPDLVRANPQVHQVLEQAEKANQQRHLEVAKIYLTSDDDQREVLKAKVKTGELGNSVDVLAACVNGLMDAEGAQVDRDRTDSDRAAEDLWIELLEINRNDPRLIPLREKAIFRDWYWDTDSPVYTLMETLHAYEEATEEILDIDDFVKRNEDAIMSALRGSYGWSKYGKGVELTRERREFSTRLGKILEEIYEAIRGNVSAGLVSELPSSLLLASLYTPEPEKS